METAVILHFPVNTHVLSLKTGCYDRDSHKESICCHIVAVNTGSNGISVCLLQWKRSSIY